MSSAWLGPVFAAAEQYAAAGLSCIPIRPDGTKAPCVAWKEYQARIAGPEERSRWWANAEGCGIAIVAGPVSGELEMLDFDDLKAFEEWGNGVKEFSPELAHRLVVIKTPRPGMQVPYRCPKAGVNQVLARDEEGKVRVETRGKGGYFLTYPSGPACHERRRPYVLKHGSLETLPTLSEDEHAFFLSMARALDLCTLPFPAPHSPARTQPTPAGARPGDDYNQRGDAGELLSRHGWVLEGTHGDEQYWRRPGKKRGHSATWNTQKRVLCSFSPNAAPLAGEKEGVGYSLFGMYAALEHGGDFHSAAKSLGAQGYGPPAAPTGAPSAAAAIQDRATPPSSAGPNSPALPKGFTAAEVNHMEINPPTYVIPGFVVEGLNILVGAPKIGKSWLALAFALAVSADSGRALGTVEVEPGGCLSLFLEDPLWRLQQRMRQLLADEPAPERLLFFNEWPSMVSGGLDLLRRQMDLTQDLKLVIIDTLARFRGVRENKGSAYDQESAEMAAVKRAADERRIALLLLHHLNKIDRDDPVEQISGTMGVPGGADSILILKRARGATDGTLFVTGRNVAEMTHAIRFSPEVGSWTLLGEASQVKKSAERKAVLFAVHELGGWATGQDIAIRLELPYPSTRVLLWRMVQDGDLLAQRGGYALPPGAPPIAASL